LSGVCREGGDTRFNRNTVFKHLIANGVFFVWESRVVWGKWGWGSHLFGLSPVLAIYDYVGI